MHRKSSADWNLGGIGIFHRRSTARLENVSLTLTHRNTYFANTKPTTEHVTAARQTSRNRFLRIGAMAREGRSTTKGANRNTRGREIRWLSNRMMQSSTPTHEPTSLRVQPC